MNSAAKKLYNHVRAYCFGVNRPQRQRESYFPFPVRTGSLVAVPPSGATPGKY